MPEEDPDKMLNEQLLPQPPAEPPQPLTPFQTGDRVRLKTGGPVMTLGVVLPSHTLHSQVECRWFVNAMPQDKWYYLGQLDILTKEEVVAQLGEEARERSIEAGRKHELEKLRLQKASQSKLSPPIQ